MKIRAIVDDQPVCDADSFNQASAMHAAITDAISEDGPSRIQLWTLDDGEPKRRIVDWTFRASIWDATCEDANALHLYVGVCTGHGLDEWFDQDAAA